MPEWCEEIWIIFENSEIYTADILVWFHYTHNQEKNGSSERTVEWYMMVYRIIYLGIQTQSVYKKNVVFKIIDKRLFS